jgi:hypothetical protein
MRQIARDPFARETLFRETVNVSLAHGGCAECGSKRVRRGGPHRDGCDYSLFRYYVEKDAINVRKEAAHGGKLFCGVSCLRSYRT